MNHWWKIKPSGNLFHVFEEEKAKSKRKYLFSVHHMWPVYFFFCFHSWTEHDLWIAYTHTHILEFGNKSQKKKFWFPIHVYTTTTIRFQVVVVVTDSMCCVLWILALKYFVPYQILIFDSVFSQSTATIQNRRKKIYTHTHTNRYCQKLKV